MDEVMIEQLGGFAGFGGPHLESSGTVSLSNLSDVDRERVNELFKRHQHENALEPTSAQADQFKYRLTRRTQNRTVSIEAAESEVPDALKASLKTKIK